MRLRGEFHLRDEPANVLATGFFKGSVNPGDELFKERVRTAMQLVAVQAEDIIELRLKAGQGLLLGAFQALGKMLEAAKSFVGALERCFETLCLRLRGIANAQQTTLRLRNSRGGCFVELRGSTIRFLLNAIQNRVGIFGERCRRSG